jgi:calcineurin-like phosphoesterase
MREDETLFLSHPILIDKMLTRFNQRIKNLKNYEMLNGPGIKVKQRKGKETNLTRSDQGD